MHRKWRKFLLLPTKNLPVIPISYGVFAVPESKRYLWPEVPLEESIVDAPLAWPSGTKSILDRAFAMGLSRGCAWEAAPSSCEAFKMALTAAARVYKRGVPCHTGLTITHTLGNSGTYNISFKDNCASVYELLTSPEYGLLIFDAQIKVPKPLEAKSLSLSLTESDKSLAMAAKLTQDPRFKAADHIVVVGGGLLADLLGFAAANSAKKFSFVPTTLLAMVDACVGGKTGVNDAAYGKNQIGLFAFPQQVLIAPEFLQTLSQTEFASGAAEAIKHALLAWDQSRAHKLALDLSRRTIQVDDLSELIKIKADIVQRDPYEQSERAVLNFGHSFGHALEAYAHQHNSHISHGHCVAAGMIFAAILSTKIVGLKQDEFARIVNLVNTAVTEWSTLASRVLRFGLQRETIEQQWAILKQFLAQDKKNLSLQADYSFVLLNSIGDVATSKRPNPFLIQVSTAELDSAWNQMHEMGYFSLK